MKSQNKLTSILFFLSGILFIISAIIGKDYMFVPIGCCFITLGSVYLNKKEDNKKKDK